MEYMETTYFTIKNNWSRHVTPVKTNQTPVKTKTKTTCADQSINKATAHCAFCVSSA